MTWTPEQIAAMHALGLKPWALRPALDQGQCLQVTSITLNAAGEIWVNLSALENSEQKNLLDRLLSACQLTTTETPTKEAQFLMVFGPPLQGPSQDIKAQLHLPSLADLHTDAQKKRQAWQQLQKFLQLKV